MALGSILLGPLMKGAFLLLVLYVFIHMLKKAGRNEQLLDDVKATKKVQDKINKIKPMTEKEIDDALDKGEF